MENKFVTVHGHEMRYVEAGTGTPVVMLHGLGFNASADQWFALIPYLSDDFRCIALDQVGWGWSDRPVEGYSFPLLVSSLEGFIEALGISRAIVIGHTLGGWTAALLAEERPDLVDKLVLANTAGLNPTAPRGTGTFSLPGREETAVALESAFEGSIPVTEEMVDDELARHQRPGVEESYASILRFVNDPDIRKEWSLEPRLSKINCPTLVVWGADDAIIGPQFGEKAAKLLPHGQIELIADGAHAPFARKPADFARVFRAFVEAN